MIEAIKNIKAMKILGILWFVPYYKLLGTLYLCDDI